MPAVLYGRDLLKGKLPPANLFVDLASHPDDGPYYWERAAWTKLDKIKVPMLSISPQTLHPYDAGSFMHIQ